MFREVYMHSYIRQSSVGGIEKHVRSLVILWSYPLAFQNTPKCFRYIQLWRIWRQEKEEKSSLFPYWAKLFYPLVSMYGSIVKDNKSVYLQVERKIIKETENLICRHLLKCGESIVTVITVNHPKNIESCHPLGGYVNFLPSQLPTVSDLSFSTSVALISIIESNTSFRRLTFKFLQLLDLVFVELRRGYSPWAFSYSLISCANADKKRLKVESLASLPEACSHAALALLTLCLSCSIARRTASSSEQSMIGFRPLPERVFNPSMPSDLKRFTQAFTLIWLISVCTPTVTEDSPSAFSNTARQRIRKQYFSPKRNPFSSARHSASVNSNTFGFPINHKMKCQERFYIN